MDEEPFDRAHRAEGLWPKPPTPLAVGGNPMSRIVIIGGSGHIGTYLVPRLVSAGFEVVSVSRDSG